MDQIGQLELSWIQGYSGQSVGYLTRDTVCFKCGNYIKFISEDGHENVFSVGEGIGPAAVHSYNKVFAVAEQTINPTIHVLAYPTFREVAQLLDGAKLEYTDLAFSSSLYLASVSGVPDFKVFLWNYTTGERLASVDLPSSSPLTSLGFNPANWRELFMSTAEDIVIWQIEQSDDLYIMQKKSLGLPPVSGERHDISALSLHSRPTTSMTLELPKTSVAGVRGEDAKKFEKYKDAVEKVQPISHTWAPTGDLYVGCTGGQILKVGAEVYDVHFIYNPLNEAMRTESTSDTLHLGKQKSSMSTAAESSSSTMIVTPLGPGSVNCLLLHKEGLFAAGEEGTLRQLEVSNKGVHVKRSIPFGVAIKSLSFNPAYQKLALGSSQGCIFLYNLSESETFTTLVDTHHGAFVGVSPLCPGTDISVTVREDGELQAWRVDTGKLLSAIPLGCQATSVAASPLCHIAVVGTSDGHALFVDLNKLDKPKMIHRLHIHNGPVKHLIFNKNGRLLLSASNDGHVVITAGRPSKKFEPIGFTDVPGEIMGLSSYMDDQSGTTRVVVTAQRSDQTDPGASKLVHFNLPSDLADDPRKYHASLKYDLSSEAVEKLAFNFRHPSHGIAVTAAQYAFTLGHNDKQIHKLTLPQEPPKKENSKDSYLEPQHAVPAHGLPGGQLQMSPHQKWLASVSADGRLSVRALGSLNKSVDVIAHSYAEGGVRSVTFTSDAQCLLTTGHDGTVACFKWNFSTSGAAKGQSAIESQRVFQETLRQDGQLQDDSAMLMPEWTPPPPSSRPGSATQKEEQEKMEKQKALENDQIYTTPTPVPSADATWLEIKEAEAIIEEDKKYASLKKDLRTEIRDMRRKIQAMMKDNEVVPDIEKLGREEFDLDIEEQIRLQAAGDSHVGKIREEKEFDNLRKMYLADIIRRECWDEMMVKGRGIGAFNSNLEVHNYPMKKRSREELDRLEYITKQCRLQADELKARRELTEAHSKPSAAAIDDDDHDENDEGENSEGKEQPSTTGSLGAQYGGQNELFYSQFDLHTREQKIRQIILLEDAIYRIRMEFNKEFDDVYQRKEQEISKIKDKNRRIRKIIEDLDLVMDVYEPELGPLEKPEMLLKVEDKEVKVERYLTAQQKKQLEKEQKEEEERRLREKGDNARERALDMMMGGVLEVKKEDELKKDIPIPAFMQNKPEDDWSEDEKKMVQEYEKKVKELQEEREKYRKQLEAELKKLQAQIQEGTLLYDEVLMGLHGRKIKTEMVIYQEELKILRLKYSLLIEEELNNRESELIDLLEFKKEMKNLAAEAAAESKKQVDAFRDAYENLDAHERVMDREFKRKFIDVPAVQVEQLNKLFRKRPRGQRGHIRAADSTPLFDAASSGNPFSERPSTAKKEEHAMSALEAALAEMDKEINMPEGVELPVWERLCKFRREKIEKENLVKQKAQVLASMQEFLKHRQDEFETLKTEVEDLTIAITKLQEERMRFSCNLEVQLLLKQGQVEVDSGSFIHDYKNSLLIHRSVVEDLNGRIKQLGESKISSMVESKDFRKGIIQLEWEHKKMTMEMADLKNKQRDIQNLKVTREIQAFLNEEDHDAKKAQEIQILEQTIQTQKQHHEKNVRERQRTLKELKKVIHDRSQENTKLAQDLQDLNVSVNERRHIHEVNADKRSDVGQEKRYQEIVQRRKLVDLAKAQAQEVAVLRAEVERLRMRTFPALVQVEH